MISEVDDRRKLYDFFMSNVSGPQFYAADFGQWERSMFEDCDPDGRPSFLELRTEEATENGVIMGFVQYGTTAFGFDDSGELCENLRCAVIRNLMFSDEKYGRELLLHALEQLSGKGAHGTYAFFQYFGMTCYARHGKLPKAQAKTEELLLKSGFAVDEENVYYEKKLLPEDAATGVDFVEHEVSAGGEELIEFVLGGANIGECVVQYLPQGGFAYLRWIGIDPGLEHRGLGTRCMKKLCGTLFARGITTLAADTAAANTVAQGFYIKTGFSDLGRTRSYKLVK